MKTAFKAILERHHLGDLAAELHVNAKKAYRSISRSDRAQIDQYLNEHPTRKLHLGCADNCLEGWLNSDRLPPSKQVIYIDATRTMPFPDDTFDYVYSEHMIEHVPYPGGRHMLEECHRILKPGGKVRISTPDLAFVIGLYQNAKSELQERYIKWSTETLDNQAPLCSDTFVINNFVRSWGHSFIYDEKVLRYTLERAGFKDVVRCALRESSDEALRNLENDKRMPDGFLMLESLILEGTK
jgi:predicted SAM-dependent methyltransferase